MNRAWLSSLTLVRKSAPHRDLFDHFNPEFGLVYRIIQCCPRKFQRSAISSQIAPRVWRFAMTRLLLVITALSLLGACLPARTTWYEDRCLRLGFERGGGDFNDCVARDRQ